MNQLNIALNEFKTLIENKDKDELNSIVLTIDNLDNRNNSYTHYLSEFDEEYSSFFNEIHDELLYEKEFTLQSSTECKPEVIKYINNYKVFDFKSFDIVESVEVNNQIHEIYPEAA